MGEGYTRKKTYSSTKGQVSVTYLEFLKNEPLKIITEFFKKVAHSKYVAGIYRINPGDC